MDTHSDASEPVAVRTLSDHLRRVWISGMSANKRYAHFGFLCTASQCQDGMFASLTALFQPITVTVGIIRELWSDFFCVLFFDAHSSNGFFYFWCFVWIYFRKPQDLIKTTLVWFFWGDRGVVEFPLIPWKVLNVVKVKYLISSIAVFSFISGAFSAFRKRFKTKMTIFGRFTADDVMRLKQ